MADATDITDVDSFYDMDGYDTVNVIRVDIRTETTPGICVIDDQSGCTLDDVKADIDGDDDFKVEIPIHFQSDDFPDDSSFTNANLRQRGATSRLAPQKSFRIKLDSKEVLWRNERRLQLNKHPYERTRIRNKMAFDLMRELPHLPSLRTQFVNLWIDDGAGPEDYGLFTHVEFAGKEYLVNRGRDKDDNLYKIEFFEFSQGDLDNLQVDENGEPLDEDRFESRLDIKRGDDHSKLIEMMMAMNDPAQSFEAVLDKYFNHNNVLMWITANLLLHQTDAITHNFYLYNPLDSDKFYFLPWDYDGGLQPESILTNSFANDELSKRLFFGYARGANSNFVSRYYKLPGMHEKILAAADELRNNYLTDANIDARAARYNDVVAPFLMQSPDVDFQRYNPNIPASFSGYVAGIHDQLRTDFAVPMPPEFNEPEYVDGSVFLSWTPAFDVTRSNTLSYDIDIATSVEFEAGSVVYSVTGIEDAESVVEHDVDLTLLPEAELYVRLVARGDSDPERLWQVANDKVRKDGTTWFGMISIDNR